jgi:hypothetical protein
MQPHLHIAIPAINEMAYLPFTLEDISKQHCTECFTVYVCVNQPEEWWNDPEKKGICENNQQLIQFLQEYDSFPIIILDFSSIGKGWQGKKHGVGWARKALFDHILQTSSDEDIIISLDADTRFGATYFQSIVDQFAKSSFPAISVPYYHQLTEDDRANRAILRYELYMRNYVLNMYEIGSPFNFTAIGSAIAMRVKGLRKIGGITPMKSGEDFYLLQKFRKMGPISNWNSTLVYPATRFSSRVYFGTGPAMIKGDAGDWSSYPIYHFSLFKEIKNTYDQLETLFKTDIDTPFLEFLKEQYQENDLWGPLRKNFKAFRLFERAFHEKADGLRILQYLKFKNQRVSYNNNEAFKENMLHFFNEEGDLNEINEVDLEGVSTTVLNEYRDLFFKKEQQLRFSEKNG